MAAEGLVTQRASPDDRRALHLALTPAGRDVVARARPLQARFNEAMTAGFDAAEQAVIARFLDHLIAQEFQ